MAKARESRRRRSAPNVFPGPNHDHGRCSSEAMAVAEAKCLEHGRRLTPIRRHVLGVLLGSHQPLGAYEIMERLAPQGPRPAPITVYRALEFLRENGLIHRIESLNAFLACVPNHASAQPVGFLICERFGVGGDAPIVLQSMTNTDPADIAATTAQVAALARAGSEIVRITVDRDEAAAAVPLVKERLGKMGVDVPIIGDFHYIGHQLLADHPACAEALDKYRINPGHVGFT